LALNFTLNQLTTTWEVKLTDCSSGQVRITTDISSVGITFTKVDGTTFTKTGTLIDDPQAPTEKLIQYRNIPPEASILDLLGSWTYAGFVVLTDTGTFRTSEKKVFWVVP